MGKGRPVIRQMHPTDPQIRLKQGCSTERTTIQRSALDKSHRMLGVLLNPLGDFGDQIISLKTKADTFALRSMSPRLNSADVRIFHRSTYVPSMRYGLAALAVDEEVLGQVQSRIVQSILKKWHVQSTIPTAIRHGPVDFGGLGIYDLRTEAGLEAIKFFRDSIYATSETGKLLRMNLRYSQLESGIGQPLLEYPGIHLPYITPSWIMSLRQYLYNHNLTITVTDENGLQLHGPHDQFIMQQQHLERYSSSQQRDINFVRLYLQVQTLADLADQHRKNCISLSYLDAFRPKDFVNQAVWPRQAEPTKAQRRLWKRYLRSSFLRYVPYWITDPRIGVAPTLPTTSEQQPPVSTLEEHLLRLPKSHQRLLDGFHQLATDRQIWKAFRSRRRIHFATDGGLHAQRGTHGWVIATGRKTLFQCAGPVDGPLATASSTRSELAGYASALILIRALSDFWGLRHRSRFHWYCDSKAAIARVKRFAMSTSYRTKMPDDADLVSIISTCHQNLRTLIRIHWVKGHQDEGNSKRPLSFASSLNIKADALATEYRKTGRLKPTCSVLHELDQGCSISINGERVTSQYDDSIRFHVNGYHLRQYVQEKQGWSDSVWDSVDFYTFGQHFRRLKPQQQVTWMKFVHSQLPTGARRYIQSPVKDERLGLCPCCKEEPETTTHLLQCRCNKVFQPSLETLRSDICKVSHPASHLIYSGLYSFFTQPDAPFEPAIDSYPEHLRSLIMEALSSQRDIGWHQATKGFLSKKWRELASKSLYNIGNSDQTKGLQSMKSTLDAIHAHCIRIWLSRNQALHSNDDDAVQEIRSAERAEIQLLHGQPDSMRTADRYLCSRSLQKLLDSSPSTCRRWLRRVKASRELHSKDGSQQSLITSFFGQPA